MTFIPVFDASICPLSTHFFSCSDIIAIEMLQQPNFFSYIFFGGLKLAFFPSLVPLYSIV